MTAWPDVEVAFMALLDPLGVTYLRRTPEWEDDLAAAADQDPDAAAHHIFAIGGSGGDEIMRSQRLIVDTFARSRDAAQDAAEAVRALLIDSPHATDEGLLDLVVCEIEPIQMPYPSDRTIQYRATYRVDTRPNPVTL